VTAISAMEPEVAAPGGAGPLGRFRCAVRSAFLDYPASWLRRRLPAGRDAVLYALAAAFAGLTIALAGIPLYRAWGEMAVGPYVGAALVAFGAARWQRRRQRTGVPLARRTMVVLRLVAFGIALIGATVAPLAMEVIWRSEGNAAAHVQPEVVVVERAGVRVASGKDPYRVIDRNGHILIHQSSEPVYELYYPYLPGMVIFGFSSGSKVEARLTDARLQFLVFTFAVAAFALWRLKAPAERRVRSWQVLTALPTAALPLATGGDDMPVVALMLLGLVGLQRRRPYLAGLALGAASSLKFTAWPLAVLALWVARDRQGRKAAAWTAAGIVSVVAPVVLPFAASNASAFVDNVIRFPLGLAGVASPAASPLPGHLIVSAFPGLHHAYVIALVACGAVALGIHLVRHPPRTAADVAVLTGVAMTAAILLAPATRVGYLLYPIDLLVWGWMLRRAEVPEPVPVVASGGAMPIRGLRTGEG
jgi:hypothetical protein